MKKTLIRVFKFSGIFSNSAIRVFRFSDFKKEIAKHFFCSFVHFKLIMNFNRDLRVFRVGTHLLMIIPFENNIL